MDYKDSKFIVPDDAYIAAKQVKKVIDESIAEYDTELQRIKDEVFHLVTSGNCPLARDKAEASAPFQTAIAT